MGQHMPKFMFLHTMGLLQSGDRKGFMEALKEIVEKYPKNEISEIAGNIVKGLQEDACWLRTEVHSALYGNVVR
mgnify:CR=1 FL=1